MRFARFCVLAGFLTSPAARPAAAYSFPAVSVQHLLTDKDCETVPDLLGLGGARRPQWYLGNAETRRPKIPLD